MSLIKPAAASRHTPRATALSSLAAALHWLERALTTYRQRRALMSLSDAMLKDVGLSRADAEREGTRRFWDLE